LGEPQVAVPPPRANAHSVPLWIMTSIRSLGHRSKWNVRQYRRAQTHILFALIKPRIDFDDSWINTPHSQSVMFWLGTKRFGKFVACLYIALRFMIIGFQSNGYRRVWCSVIIRSRVREVGGCDVQTVLFMRFHKELTRTISRVAMQDAISCNRNTAISRDREVPIEGIYR